MLYKKNSFNSFANFTCRISGHPYTFLAAIAIIVIWGLTGPIFHFNDTWQLVINTGTTIVTFLMVFLIQNSQNRDSYAIQLKLDELIRSVEGAHNSLLDIEEMTDTDLVTFKQEYAKLAEKAREGMKRGKLDVGIPNLKLNKKDK